MVPKKKCEIIDIDFSNISMQDAFDSVSRLFDKVEAVVDTVKESFPEDSKEKVVYHFSDNISKIYNFIKLHKYELFLGIGGSILLNSIRKTVRG